MDYWTEHSFDVFDCNNRINHIDYSEVRVTTHLEYMESMRSIATFI